MPEVKALPQISTLALPGGARALARHVNIPTVSEPDGAEQADLLGDVFNALYQPAAPFREPAPIERTANETLLKWVQETKGWGQAKEVSQSNIPAACTTANLMWETLRQEEALQEALKAQRNIEEKTRQAEQLAAQAEAVAALAQAAGDADVAAQAMTLADQADDLLAQAEALADQVQAGMEALQNDPTMNAKVAAAARQAAQAGRETAQELSGWGFGAGAGVRTDPNAAAEFARRNDARLREIARLAGRVRGAALHARRTQVPVERLSAEVGLTQDIQQIFPDELLRLHKDMPAAVRAEAAMDYLDVGLLGWEKESGGEKAGPVVVAVDVSGSMGGARQIVGFGIALGLAQVAQAEGRAYILFTFGADQDPVRVITSADPWMAHMDWAGLAAAGGTSFNRAITETISRLAQMDEAGHNADAVFISDGEARVGEEVAARWTAYRQESGARLFFVPVGGWGYGSIDSLADRTLALDEITPQDALRLAQESGRWFR